MAASCTNANLEHIRSEAAFAKLCGACPVPASNGKTGRNRLNGGGNRQANAALYRVVITRMRGHQPTLDYVRRRTAEGKSKAEIVRCPKRYVARYCSATCAPLRSRRARLPHRLDRHRSISALAIPLPLS